MAQIIIRRPTTGGSVVDAHVDADRDLLRRLLQEARANRGKGFWADSDTTIFAGNAAHQLAPGTNIDQLVDQIIPP